MHAANILGEGHVSKKGFFAFFSAQRLKKRIEIENRSDVPKTMSIILKVAGGRVETKPEEHDFGS